MVHVRAKAMFVVVSVGGLALALSFGAVALAAATATPGTIGTIAGNGTAGFCGDGGDATSACLNFPQGVVVDRHGNVFVADTANHVIRRVDRGGVITTFAGNGTHGYCGDNGPATSACLYSPNGVAVDRKGDVFINDEGNHVIREVDTAGVITTVVGKSARQPHHCVYDGKATQACIDARGIAVDNNGNLYIADYFGSHVWKVHRGRISNFAGTGTRSKCGDNGPAISACIGLPQAVGIDSAGNVYIADWDNHDIRRVDSTGIITTFAGTGAYPPCGGGNDLGDGGPATSACMYFPNSIATDASGNVYFADDVRVRVIDPSGTINTFAGGGSGTFCGDGGPPTSACLSGILAIAFDPAGNLDIADGTNHRIRQVVAPFGT